MSGLCQVALSLHCLFCFLKLTFFNGGGKSQQEGDRLLQPDCNEAGAVMIIGTTTGIPCEGVVRNIIKAFGQFPAVCVRLLVFEPLISPIRDVDKSPFKVVLEEPHKRLTFLLFFPIKPLRCHAPPM